MKWLPSIPVVVLLSLSFGIPPTLELEDSDQAPFRVANPASACIWDLDARPDANATGNLIFDSVGSLMQHWPNTRYRNGHTIVPASLPIGTLLYHGRADARIPTEPQWTATDAEHSYLFCRKAPKATGCWMLTLVVVRPLKLVYFDGTSAGNMEFGTMDAQDIVGWGRARPERWDADWERLDSLCAWGRRFGVDGFVRMEMDFEVMLCDFTAGLEVSSFRNVVATGAPIVSPPDPQHGTRAGWNEVMLSGSWHNRFPGDTRVHLDLSGLVSFYDDALVPSLVSHRVGVERYFHRPGNISKADTHAFMERLEDGVARELGHSDGSGIDWRALVHVITNRYADRLEMVGYLLDGNGNVNGTGTGGRVQTQLRHMLQPYILHGLIPSPDSIAWAEPVYEACARSHVRDLGAQRMTESEEVILGAIGETTKEICRVVTRMWAQGVLAGLDVVVGSGVQNAASTENPNPNTLLEGWKLDVRHLMSWLDWSVWVKCRPACDFEEFCYLPTWPLFYFPRAENDDWMRPTPRCVSKTDPFVPYLV